MPDDHADKRAHLIEERDQYMAARLRQEVERSGHANVLAVVGAGSAGLASAALAAALTR